MQAELLYLLEKDTLPRLKQVGGGGGGLGGRGGADDVAAYVAHAWQSKWFLEYLEKDPSIYTVRRGGGSGDKSASPAKVVAVGSAKVAPAS